MKTIQGLTVAIPLLLMIALAGAGMRNVDTEPYHSVLRDDGLADLTSFELVREAFNHDEGKVRIVTLLSPSCGYCIKGYRYMRKILDEIDDPNLRLYIVWLPMLSGDSKPLAERMSREADDPRVVHQSWDETRIAGKAWQDRMDMDGIAWDVYYVYGPDSSWGDSGPTSPDYWEHQLGELDPARRLSYNRFKDKVLEMLQEGA